MIYGKSRIMITYCQQSVQGFDWLVYSVAEVCPIRDTQFDKEEF